MSKGSAPIGSGSDQSASAEELQSGTSGLEFQTSESVFGTTRTRICPPEALSVLIVLHVCLFITSFEKQYESLEAPGCTPPGSTRFTHPISASGRHTAPEASLWIP